MINLRIIFLVLFSSYFYSCATGSMEYRSCRAAANVEKDYDRAESLCLEALQIEPDNPQVPYFLATKIYKRKNNYEAMAKMLNLSEKKATKEHDLTEPFSQEASLLKDIKFKYTVEFEEDGKKMLFFNKLLDAIALEKYSIWREFLIQGLEHEENEEAIKAIEMYNKAKNLIPSNSKSYIQLFNIYLNQNSIDQAKKIIYEAYEKDTSNVIINYYIGDLEGQMKNYKVSEKFYKYAADNASNPKFMYGLLYSYIDQGKNQIAIEYSEQLLEENPEDQNLTYNIAVLYQRLGQEALDSASEHYNKINSADNPSADLISTTLEKFKNARKYLYESKSFFEFAYDLTLDNSNKLDEIDVNRQLDEIDGAQKEMKKYIKRLDTIYIPDLQEKYRKVK
jgi:tetratricopeptide (TPR) repeat protein